MRTVPYNDSLAVTDKVYCESCGSLVMGDGDTDRIGDPRVEVVYRLAERILWDDMTSKAVGTMVRVLCAVTLLPTATARQLSAAVGVSHPTVLHVLRWLQKNTPQIYKAVWRDR